MVKIIEPKIDTVELKPDGTYGKFAACSALLASRRSRHFRSD